MWMNVQMLDRAVASETAQTTSLLFPYDASAKLNPDCTSINKFQKQVFFTEYDIIYIRKMKISVDITLRRYREGIIPSNTNL